MPQIKKFYKTNLPKNGNSNQEYNFVLIKWGPQAPRTARRAVGGPKGPPALRRS